MTTPFLSILSLNRRFTNGGKESLNFIPGVNLLVGRPNTGKTKWLETLDFLFGDLGQNPFGEADGEGLFTKYDAASAKIRIGEDEYWISRRWMEAGAKGKVFVDKESMSAKDFQHWLLDKLGMPLLSFPKGNPMSGQTWPELSFRMMLRHIYRRQSMWTDIADRQPESEQLASILQMLGLAEHVFSDDYGQLIALKLQADRLAFRREHYISTLNELSRDLLDDGDIQLGVSTATIAAARKRLDQQVAHLRAEREALLFNAAQTGIPADRRSRVAELGHLRADVAARLDQAAKAFQAAADRISELRRYRADLLEEIERMDRAADAGAVLADLRITHCPACDQIVQPAAGHSDDCFLCHQQLPTEPDIAGLGAARLRFERERLAGELAEADQLIIVVGREQEKQAALLTTAESELQAIERELVPTRTVMAALVQDGVTALDIALGQVDERYRQIDRVDAALAVGADLTRQIAALQKAITPLEESVANAADAQDFDAAAGLLEDGMNAYLVALNQLKPDTWRHNLVRVELSGRQFRILVGRRPWAKALGGTDSLYFLMAYHFGLLKLSPIAGCHYPGLSIIDVPGDFLGEAIGDKENFIVQPFIDLLNTEQFDGAQLIITGASFKGLQGGHFERLTTVHVA
jgi:hypothetical protein